MTATQPSAEQMKIAAAVLRQAAAAASGTNEQITTAITSLTGVIEEAGVDDDLIDVASWLDPGIDRGGTPVDLEPRTVEDDT